jgi:hypothetical protein
MSYSRLAYRLLTFLASPTRSKSGFREIFGLDRPHSALAPWLGILCTFAKATFENLRLLSHVSNTLHGTRRGR